jgi:hypothetical protein
MHLLSGATMLGAFFILTDPVTASTTNRGRLIFGAGGPAGLAHPQLWRLSGRRGVCRPAGEHYRSADRLLHAPARTATAEDPMLKNA